MYALVFPFVGSVSRRQGDREEMRVQIQGPPKTAFVTFVLYTKLSTPKLTDLETI